MKKIIISILALAALFSCTKEQTAPQEQPSEKKGTTYSIEFSAPCNEDGTKITLGDYDSSEHTYTLKWCVGDVLQIYEYDGSNRTWIDTTDALTSDDIDEDGNATFKFTTEAEAGTELKFNLNSNMVDGKTYGKSILPTEQVQNGLGTDNTDITPYDYAFYSGTIKLGTTTKVSSTMQRPLATVKILFWSTAYEGWKVEKITVSRNDFGQIAGEYTTNSATSSAKSFVGFTSADKRVISLTFNDDVTVPAEDDAEPAFLQVFPTYVASIETSEPISYVVMVQISKDGVHKSFARKFTACLKSGEVKNLKVGQLETSSSKFQVKEYSKIWERGGDITFADVTFNRNTEGYTDTTKVSASALTYSTMNDGGLVFVTDDADMSSTIDLASTYSRQRPIATKKALTLVGDRIYDGGQTAFNVVEMRTFGDVLMANLKLVASDSKDSTPASQYMFTKQSSDASSTSLKLVDCQIDAKGLSMAVIGDKNGNSTTVSAAYSAVTVYNCVIKLPVGNAFYRLCASDDVTSRSVVLNNNVFWWKDATSAAGANIFKFNSYTAKGMTIEMSSNTIENCFPQGLIYASVSGVSAENMLGNVTSDKDLVYAHDQTSLSFQTGKFLLFNSDKLGSCTNAYMAANNCKKSTGDAASIQPWHFNSTSGCKSGSSCTTCPFASDWIESDGYFPVNSSVVTNGAGATYDTKYYFEVPE